MSVLHLPIGVFDEEMQLVAETGLEVRSFLLLYLETCTVRHRATPTEDDTTHLQIGQQLLSALEKALRFCDDSAPNERTAITHDTTPRRNGEPHYL